MKEQLNIFLTAVIFLTRLPVSGWVSFKPDYLNKSTVYFPLVGLIVGALGLGMYFLTSSLFSNQIAILSAMLATVLLTGAFHEDGLADTCDGFGGSYDAEKVMTIMKDSRLGTYGVLGIWFLMTFKFLILLELHTINPLLFIKAFLVGHVLGRYSSIVLIFRYPYVGSSQSSKPIADNLSGLNFGLASIFAVGFSLILLQEMIILPLSLAAVLIWTAGRYFSKRIGGITGDTLGAANQIVEVSVFFGLQLQLNIFLVGSTIWKFF